MPTAGFGLTYASPVGGVVAFIRRPIDGSWWDAAGAKWSPAQAGPLKLANVPASPPTGYANVYTAWVATDPALWADGRYEVWYHAVGFDGKPANLLPPCCGDGHVAGPASLWLRGGSEVPPGSVGAVAINVAAWPAAGG